MHVIFDIGATKMRVAVSQDGESFDEPKVVPTPALTGDGSDVVGVFKDTVGELLGGSEPEALAGGVTRKLAGLPSEIGRLFSCPVFIENDSALCGLGEVVAGAGRGSDIVAYLTVSTGVGGARIVDGKIDRSHAGFEPGYQIVASGLTLEQLVSGRATSKKYGKSPREITDEAVWDELAGYLALGLHNTIVHWSPEVVVLGGSMMKVPGIALPAVQKYLIAMLTIFPTVPELRLAELGDFGGLHGALELLRQKLAR